MKLDVPSHVLRYAGRTYQHLVPHKRQAGFDDLTPEERGKGDYMDLLGSLVLFDLLGRADRVCAVNITSGAGDANDMKLRINNNWRTLNVKTSSYAPFSDRLHLYVKEEEIEKDIDLYVQVFVHTREDDEPPHVHVAGYIERGDPTWLSFPVEPIPRTNHQGLCIPVQELRMFEHLIAMTDEKF